MIELAISLLSGVLFAMGLCLSGMIDPQNIKDFLNILGDWNPALMLVMAGSVGLNIISFRFILRRAPLLTTQHTLPQKLSIDWQLLVGSALFGLGWGISGLCPGPVLVNLILFDSSISLFFASMISGMLLYRYLAKRAEG